jgi:predicted anti-sigma-YlaC factor YlaD
MTELSCEQARDLAPEYGLGILAPDERVAMTTHVLRCPECRSEAEEFARLSDDLMQVVPAAEPPPGFDGRVLESLRPRRSRLRYRLMAGTGAATGAAAAAAIVLILTSGTHKQPEIRVNLVADGHTVGSVYTEGRPPYLWMAVEHLAGSGSVSCQIVEAGGKLVTLGSFDVVGGSGAWATPEPSGLGQIATARLVAADGKVLAQATFKP